MDSNTDNNEKIEKLKKLIENIKQNQKRVSEILEKYRNNLKND
jgi:molecular chaperone GrpE (heat shock protein)